MKTATGLALIAVGAILTFAVSASTPGFNLKVTGVVIMLTGLAGLLIPRKGYGWLRKRLIIPPRARVRRGAPTVVEETRYPPYVVRNPGTARNQVGLPEKPFIDPDPARVKRAPGTEHREPGHGQLDDVDPRPPDEAAPRQDVGEEIIEEFYDQ